MITSKMTDKGQTTIPEPVRKALRLSVGDEIAYVIDNGRVTISRANAVPAEDPFAAFSEWDSDADRAAYAKL